MAINVNQALAGLPIRTPAVGEALNSRGGSPANAAAPAAETDLQEGGIAPPKVVPGSGANTKAQVSAPQSLDKAVEQANRLAEANLRATNRSVTFSKDDQSGRIQITIRSEGVDGEEVLRQIPPSSFFKLVERLEALNASEDGHRGALVDLNI
jgi:uncharacterized FlaG/YvyC family protein